MPLHLLAFVVLYIASVRIMNSEILSLARDAASDRLAQVVREIDSAAMTPGHGKGQEHAIRSLIASQREISLFLFLTPDRFMGPSLEVPLELHTAIGEFFENRDEEKIWRTSLGGQERLRGLRRVVAKQQCAPCHQVGETTAVAAMSLDITRMAGRVRTRSRLNLALLIMAWAVLLGAINILVKRSIERFGARFEAQLAAAEAGDPAVAETGQIVLDPATAQLHGALRSFLERQRRRQAEVATRLEHSAQLASLGRLAAGLAHEIKNPLAGIQGALEILKQDDTDNRNAQLYSDMLEELARVNTTLQLLLESARPSPARLAQTDPEQIIKDTVNLLGPGFKRKDISLTYEIAPETGTALIDSSKMRQVLINLVQNAAEAMESGGKIVIRAGRFPEGDSGIILAVEDDGPGISEEAQKKIFEPFFTTKFTGTGLGLAISNRLVEQHGGSLEVDSTPGRGATFYILLPTPRPADEAIESNPTLEE